MVGHRYHRTSSRCDPLNEGTINGFQLLFVLGYSPLFQIRGAPAIASLAGLAFSHYLARARRSSPSPDFLSSPEALKAHVSPILDFLFTARPTAVNLGAATRRLERTLQSSLDAGKDAHQIAEDLIQDGRQVAAEDVGRNKAMAKWGGDWLVELVKSTGASGDGLNVLTVCNTGSLATSVERFFSPSKLCDQLKAPTFRDTAPPLVSSHTYTKRESLGEPISHRLHHIIKVLGA